MGAERMKLFVRGVSCLIFVIGVTNGCTVVDVEKVPSGLILIHDYRWFFLLVGFD